jgi:hypothetical protein
VRYSVRRIQGMRWEKVGKKTIELI